MPSICKQSVRGKGPASKQLQKRKTQVGSHANIRNQHAGVRKVSANDGRVILVICIRLTDLRSNISDTGHLLNAGCMGAPLQPISVLTIAL